MLLAKTTEPAASRIPTAAEFTLGRRLRKAGHDDAGAGHTRPHAPRNRVPAGNVESLRLGPNADPLNASLAVTSRAPLSTRSLSAECMAQCASLDFLLCVFAFPATNFTWTYSAVTGNCPWSVSQFEEALTLAGESLPTTTECEACALIRPERAQSKPPQIHGFVRTRSRCRHRNSFNFAARLVCGGRTVHPVSRVFRARFTSGNRPHASSGPSAEEEYYVRAGQIAQRKCDRAPHFAKLLYN
jgi:hypothetical protein